MQVKKKFSTLYDTYKKDPSRRKLLLEEEFILDVTESLCMIMNTQGITRADLARHLGKTKSFVTQILSGKNLTLRTLANVADALGYKPKLELTLALDDTSVTTTSVMWNEDLTNLATDDANLMHALAIPYSDETNMEVYHQVA